MTRRTRATLLLGCLGLTLLFAPYSPASRASGRIQQRAPEVTAGAPLASTNVSEAARVALGPLMTALPGGVERDR